MSTVSRVTVMIPTYNQVSALRECVASALEQDYPNLEILVGDDCSTDETQEFLAGVDDSRLRVVRHTRNMGRVGNYHALLHSYATGEWVLNLDGDDLLINPHAISALAAHAERDRRVTMVVGSVITVRTAAELSAAQRAGSVRHSDAPTTISGISLVEDYWRDDRGMKHAGVLYHRETALNLDFYRKDIISSDIESLLRLALRGNVAIISDPIAAWRIHDGNESGNTDMQPRLANLELIDGVAEEMTKTVGASRTRRWCRRMRHRMVYGTVTRLTRLGRRADARVFLRHAIPSGSERVLFLLRPKVIARVVFRLR
tara:strand:- start:485 stop:1429 length:945 start_codon:yes stop_codon:yes gene_type:complete